MTTEEFITKARAVHGDKYDYSKVKYVNNKTTVCITCPTHGKFEIIPETHLYGCKCPECERLDEIANRRIHNLINKIEFPLPSSFVAIDFETLYSQPLSACSVGMVKFKDGQIDDTFYSLIKPPENYEGKNGEIKTNIHGIKEENLVSQQTMEVILPKMEHFAEGLPLVAHHADTERCCIKDTSNFYGIQISLNYNHIYDTQKISELVELLEGRLISGTGSHTLDAVCCRFGVEEKEHHHAFDDAKVCGELFILFTKKLSNRNTIKFPLREEIYKPATLLKSKQWKKEKYKQEDKIQREDLDNIPANHFKGKLVCLTGFVEAKSQEYGHILRQLGAVLRDSVSKKTDILICGPNPGPSKRAQAEEFHIKMINEEDLLHLINYECLDLFN